MLIWYMLSLLARLVIAFLALSLLFALIALALGYKGYDPEELVEKLFPQLDDNL